jgi:hypothetical protein
MLKPFRMKWSLKTGSYAILVKRAEFCQPISKPFLFFKLRASPVLSVNQEWMDSATTRLAEAGFRYAV